jgi:hypothetical protein
MKRRLEEETFCQNRTSNNSKILITGSQNKANSKSWTKLESWKPLVK